MKNIIKAKVGKAKVWLLLVLLPMLSGCLGPERVEPSLTNFMGEPYAIVSILDTINDSTHYFRIDSITVNQPSVYVVSQTIYQQQDTLAFQQFCQFVEYDTFYKFKPFTYDCAKGPANAQVFKLPINPNTAQTSYSLWQHGLPLGSFTLNSQKRPFFFESTGSFSNREESGPYIALSDMHISDQNLPDSLSIIEKFEPNRFQYSAFDSLHFGRIYQVNINAQ